MKKVAPSRRTRVVNTFGTLGYLSLIFQWAWSLLLLFYPQLESGHGFLYSGPTSTASAAPSFSLAPTPLVVGISLLITLFVIIVTVIAIIKLPKTVGRQGGKIAQDAATAIVPVITHHAKLPEKKKRELSYRIVAGFKCILLIVPLALVLFVSETVPLDSSLIIVIAGFTAACSALWFALQYGLALLLRIPTRFLW